MAKAGVYRFSFGPWNISTGSDPFGPAVRKEVPFAKKVAEYSKLGFTHVQLHDDDVVPADWDATQTAKGVAKVKKLLEGEGLKGEFIAPRLWEDPRTIDGGYTSNSPRERKYARERSRRAVDIANLLDMTPSKPFQIGFGSLFGLMAGAAVSVAVLGESVVFAWLVATPALVGLWILVTVMNHKDFRCQDAKSCRS